MPGALIAVDQLQGATTVHGVAGVSRNDLWVGGLLTLRSTLSGNLSQEFNFLDAPPGSGITISGADTPTATAAPDLVGSYRLQLVTNGGGPGNVAIMTLAVRYNSSGILQNRGLVVPAYGTLAGETNYGGQLRGWSPEFEAWLADYITYTTGGGGGGAANAVQLLRIPSVGTSSTTTSNPVAAGGVVVSVRVNITTGYNGGTRYQVGTAGTPNLFLDSSRDGAFTPTAVGFYETEVDALIASSSAITVTITSATAGASSVQILWASPLD